MTISCNFVPSEWRAILVISPGPGMRADSHGLREAGDEAFLSSTLRFLPR